jgi:type IV pilus assembly protein PilA
MNAQKGFTLIEILIVIGIIALLAGIVLVAINPARQFAQARNTQRTAHVNSILNAIGQYMIDNRGSLGDLSSEITDSAQEISSAGADLCDTLIPTYMPGLPTDPGAPTNGKILESEDCGASYTTGYMVSLVSGRVRICAPEAVEPSIEGSEEICVTR